MTKTEEKRKEIDDAIELATANFDLNNPDNMNLLAAVSLVVDSRLDALSKDVVNLKFRIDNVEEDLSKVSKLVETYRSDLLFRQLDMEVYNRKWQLVVKNISGEKGELNSITKQKIQELDREVFRTNATFMACHRLTQNENAKILVRFVDLDIRNVWLHNAKQLKSKNRFANVSICPDLPPVLRQLRNDVMLQRKSLPPDQKKKAAVNHLPQWPYVNMKIKDVGVKIPTITKKVIIDEVFHCE